MQVPNPKILINNPKLAHNAPPQIFFLSNKANTGGVYHGQESYRSRSG